MTAAPQRILVVDDDPEIRKLLARYIESQGFRVLLAANCRELHDRLAAGHVDLIVLDVMLPDGSGLEVCRDLRAQRSSVPIILLTALKEDVDRIIGLEIGADDYLGKPFNPRELIARVRAVLRRRAETLPVASEAKIYRFEGFTADPQTRRVTGPHGGDIELTGAEFDLLRTFLDRPGRVLVARPAARSHPRPRRRRARPLNRRAGQPASPQARRRRHRAIVQDGAQRRLSARRQGRGSGHGAMNKLRVKIALLMVVAIVSVVGLLTAVLFYLLGPPARLHSLSPVAQQVEILVRVVEEGSDVVATVPEPASGRVQEALTQRLRDTLAARGSSLAVTVSRDGWRAPLVVSIPVGKQAWVLMPISDMPRQGAPWRGLVRWLILITLGATAIAVFVANRMVRPLALLESAVEQVGTDGALPVLPERGPAEVRATAKALNSLSSRLKRSMESRMRLVAAAGHDLRTPITRMRLRAEFVEDDDDRARWLTDLDELERIADSAILLVREELGKTPPELIQLDELVGSIGAELRNQNLDVTETTIEPVKVRASRLTLNRALRNLIINAATHGVRARVEVGGANGAARIVIDDDGPGLPADLIDQVFEPFFRADPARRQDIRGAGLGLTIAREIIQRAGGTITISNRASGGLQQVVELPKAADAPG